MTQLLSKSPQHQSGRFSWMRRLGCVLLVFAVVQTPTAAADQRRSEPEDRIDVISVDRRVLAVNANGGLPELDLEIGEEVTDTQSDGLVGVAATNTRLLGITSESGSWRELRLRVSERRALDRGDRIHVGDRVALAVLDERIAALALGSTGWNELALTPREEVEHAKVGANVAGVATQLRAIGFSARSGFVSISLRPNEEIQASSVKDSSIVLTTNVRLLIFREGSGIWLERRRFKR